MSNLKLQIWLHSSGHLLVSPVDTPDVGPMLSLRTQELALSNPYKPEASLPGGKQTDFSWEVPRSCTPWYICPLCVYPSVDCWKLSHQDTWLNPRKPDLHLSTYTDILFLFFSSSLSSCCTWWVEKAYPICQPNHPKYQCLSAVSRSPFGILSSNSTHSHRQTIAYLKICLLTCGLEKVWVLGLYLEGLLAVQVLSTMSFHSLWHTAACMIKKSRSNSICFCSRHTCGASP